MAMQSKSKWYVYELVDSRTDEVFYVGKGSGNRMYQHEKDALNGVCSKKTFKINSIRDSGAEILKRQVAFFWDEQAAYDHETDLIEEIGLSNLTNILPGGQKAFDKRLAERAQRKSKPITAEWYANAIAKDSNIASWFVSFVNAAETGSVVKFTGHKLHLMVLEASFKSFFPNAWNEIKTSATALEILKPVFSSRGLELSYGSA